MNFRKAVMESIPKLPKMPKVSRLGQMQLTFVIAPIAGLIALTVWAIIYANWFGLGVLTGIGIPVWEAFSLRVVGKWTE
jgi:hypothetical protein